jgi:hypothetical protein
MIKRRPCPQCPYRCDVPSGVWAHFEYEKLRLYDAPTGDQPPSAFACHARPEQLCHGWAVVHTSRGHAYDLLALRLRPPEPIPKPAVPLFASGNEAADHGQRDIDTPSDEAQKAVETVMRYPRIQEGNAR